MKAQIQPLDILGNPIGRPVKVDAYLFDKDGVPNLRFVKRRWFGRKKPLFFYTPGNYHAVAILVNGVRVGKTDLDEAVVVEPSNTLRLSFTADVTIDGQPMAWGG